MTDKEKLLTEIDKCLAETNRLKELVTALTENAEEDEVQDFTRLHITEETFNINDKKEWHLKDVMYVSVYGRKVAFRVEHISDDRIYFVAADAVGQTDMEDIGQFLDDYLSKMPKSLRDKMVEIEHKANGKLARKSKLTLLSYANVVEDTGDYELSGADDIPFDGLLTGAERCKNKEDENIDARRYWLDTPDMDNSNDFRYVTCYGWPYYTASAANEYMVVPCFALPRKE